MFAMVCMQYNQQFPHLPLSFLATMVKGKLNPFLKDRKQVSYSGEIQGLLVQRAEREPPDVFVRIRWGTRIHILGMGHLSSKGAQW